MPAMITQTIAIFDKSNKVVSSSKQLKNVWAEAKLAYQERKAEIKATRQAKEERELQKAIRATSIAEETERSRSRPQQHRSHSQRERDIGARPGAGDRQRSAYTVQDDYSSRASSVSRRDGRPGERTPPHVPLGQFNQQLYGTPHSAPVSPISGEPTPHELVRSRTDFEPSNTHRQPHVRSLSSPDLHDAVDMDLAYGEYHEPSLSRQVTMRNDEEYQKQELSSLVTKCKMLLDEANCAQYSVKAIVTHLQKNPDAMAAVALTLAEISNIVTKMAPVALTSFKAGAPAVFAMLAAPEFLIAVGAGIGITIVMFGGYKIIKKIKARASGDKEGGKEEDADEMLDMGELNRIEHWRRGITDVETASIASGTTVEGEFITPHAAMSMGHLPLPDRPQERGANPESGKKKKHRRRRDGDSDRGSERSRDSDRSTQKRLEAPVIKVKKPSPLRRMFMKEDKSYVS